MLFDFDPPSRHSDVEALKIWLWQKIDMLSGIELWNTPMFFGYFFDDSFSQMTRRKRWKFCHEDDDFFILLPCCNDFWRFWNWIKSFFINLSYCFFTLGNLFKACQHKPCQSHVFFHLQGKNLIFKANFLPSIYCHWFFSFSRTSASEIEFMWKCLKAQILTLNMIDYLLKAVSKHGTWEAVYFTRLK